MGDAESLLLVLVLIYLAECLVWVRRGGAVFKSWFGRAFRFYSCESPLSNHRGGWRLSAPLPPLGTAILSQPPSLSFSPEGIFAYTTVCLETGGRPHQTGLFIPWREVKTVGFLGRRLRINGRLFSRAHSQPAARQWVDWMSRLCKVSPAKRAELLARMIEQSFDAARVQTRYREFQRRSATLRILNHALFFYLFLLAPWLVHRHGMIHVGWPLLVGLLAQTVTTAILFRCHHRALFPEEREDRFKHFLTMLLSPPSAIRTRDVLARHLFEAYHPLATAKILCHPSHFRSVARRFLVDLKFPLHPVWPDVPGESIATGQWFRNVMMESIERFLDRSGIDPKELIRPVPPTERAVRSYCPRCQAQFIMETGVCRDCGNRPLIRLASGAPAPEPSRAR